MSKVTVEWKVGEDFYRGQAKLRESRKGNAFFEACGPRDSTRIFVVKEDGTIISKPKSDNRRGGWEISGRVVYTVEGTVYFIGADDEQPRGRII